MARYDYKCTDCDIIFEVEHPMSEHPEVLCPTCGKKAGRVFGNYGVEFKGGGFYNTDQRGKSESSSSSGCAGCTASSCEGCSK